MKEVIILEELLKESSSKIKLFRKHLADHENGENVLTKVIKAATETSLEKTNDKVRKYNELLDSLSRHDIFTDSDKNKLQESFVRNKIYNNLNFSEKTEEEKRKELDSDKKLEVMLCIDELSSELELDDTKLFEIASKSLSLTDEDKTLIEDKLSHISSTFNQQIKMIDKTFTKKVSSFNFRIPILVLHFWLLIESVKTTYEKLNKEFRGLPRYEDWWLSELWTSHQAYYGIYKLREIITLQCLTVEQKQSWDRIFDNWLSIKLYLHSKGKLAYPYMLAFDKIVAGFTGFEEETTEENLASMDNLILNKISKEDFTKVCPDHTTISSYMRFKKKTLLKKSIEEEK